MESIGFLEFSSIARGIEAADAVGKAARVRIIFARAGCPGKYYLLFGGEVAAVQASLDAGAALGGGFVVDSCVIPRPHPQVTRAIAN
ncbi:MAG: BMC domain-containing protein, partial [Oscillospiraceae bacterium]|nr:BMC domain-containing protein [Oscillospiraceae bacterium]